MIRSRAIIEAALILAPFAIVVAAFHGLEATFPTFHGSDETAYHYPVIRTFAAQLPFPDLGDYRSATGPTYHLLFAALSLIVGHSLQALRLANLAVSLAAIGAFRRLQSHSDVVLLLAFAVSPYFFGASFVVLTDNLGILCAVLALRALVEDSEAAGTLSRQWGWFCVWVAAATTTRQLYVWLVLAGVIQVAIYKPPLRAAMSKLALLALACVPLVALIACWRGLVPPQFQSHHTSSLVNVRSALFALAVVGLYWILLFPEHALACVRDVVARPVPAAAGVIACAAALALVPMRAQPGDDGILWRASKALPTMAGTGVVFWVLVPLGAALLATSLAKGSARARMFSLVTVGIAAVNVANTTVYQKYFDPLLIVLLMLIVQSTPRDDSGTDERWSSVTRIAVVVAFLLYPLVSWKLSSGSSS